MLIRLTVRSRVLIVGLLATALGLGLHAQQTFRTGVSIVLVDLTVLASGDEPVLDLQPSQLQLLVDGSPRAILSLTYLGNGRRVGRSRTRRDLDTSAGDAALPATSDHTVVMVVDRDSIPFGEGRRALDAASRFIDRLSPADQVALVVWPDDGYTLSFATDKMALRRRLEKAVGTSPFNGTDAQMLLWEAQGIALANNQSLVLQVAERSCPNNPPESFQHCLEMIPAEARSIVIRAQQQVRATIDALRLLIKRLTAFPGPKQVVLVTSGAPIEMGDIFSEGDTAREAGATRVRVNVLQVTPQPNFAAAERRVGVTPQFQPLAPASNNIASATGGLALAPATADIFFDRLERDLAGSWLLAFEPAADDADGKAHRITVKPVGRPGVTIRARQEFRVETQVMPAAVDDAPSTPPSTSSSASSASSAPASSTESAKSAVSANLLTLASAYVQEFERVFSSVVLEERYVQIVKPWLRDPPTGPAEPELAWKSGEGPQLSRRANGPVGRRQLLSDYLLVQTPGKLWLGYRDVAMMDGKPVRDREQRVQKLFLSGSAQDQAQLQRIQVESARLNLGIVYRTINLPTFALQVLHPRLKDRFAFEPRPNDLVDASCCFVVAYRETASPTLIGTREGVDVPMRGRLWIEPATGRIRRTTVEFDESRSQPSGVLDVSYRPEPTLTVLVPARMWEWYFKSDQTLHLAGTGQAAYVEGLATYSNLRRFDVTVK